MARITVEDCLEVVDNRFELVMMAAKRARQLANGVQSQLDNNEANDKPTVLALREIAARRIDQPYIDAVEKAERGRPTRRRTLMPSAMRPKPARSISSAMAPNATQKPSSRPNGRKKRNWRGISHMERQERENEAAIRVFKVIPTEV